MSTKKAKPAPKQKPPGIVFAPKLVKTIFTQGNNGLSPLQITSMMSTALKVAGIDVPKEVTITLDAAQVIIAGGAIARDFETGASTLQCFGDIALGVQGLANLLDAIGILPPAVSDFASLGGNLALALGSGGTNVMADLGVILALVACVADVGTFLFGSSDVARANADQAMRNALKNTQGVQISNAASLVRQFAAGKINMFDMIGQIALNDPDAFATIFPNLAILFPSWIDPTITVTGVSSGLFSDSTVTESGTIHQLVTNRHQVEQVLIDNYLTKPMTDFESFETVAPIISLQALSVLGLILQTGSNKDVLIGYDFNVIGMMKGLGVTPFMIGDDWLFKGLQRNETDLGDGYWQHTLPYPPITLPLVKPSGASIVINGKPQFTSIQNEQNAKAASLIALQTKMQALDQAGDIDGLLEIPEAVAMLKRYANFVVVPTFYTVEQRDAEMSTYQNKLSQLQKELSALVVDQTNPAAIYYTKLTGQPYPNNPNNAVAISQITKELQALKKPNVLLGEITNMKLVGKSITSQKWFSYKMNVDPASDSGKLFWSYVYKNYTMDFSDYWKCLQTLQKMKQAELFSDNAEIRDFQGSIDRITALYQKALDFVLAKKLNLRMRSSIATQLGISPERMRARYDSGKNLIFYDGGLKNGTIR